MKSLRIFAVAASLLIGAAAFAQEDGNRDADGKVVRGPYVTNNFWSNWFVSVGGGIDFSLEGSLSHHLTGGVTPSYDIVLGKWIVPEVGVRLGYQGAALKNDGVKYANHLLHGDLLWNISNQFWGYKQTRVYNCVPYLSTGLSMRPYDSGKVRKEFCLGAGLLNNFRITDHWGINLDLRGMLFRGEQIDGDGGTAVLSATVGLLYNIGKCTWTRASNAGDNSALDALKAANKALEDANKALAGEKDELAKANDELAGANDKLADENQKLSDELEALKNKPKDIIEKVTEHIANGPLVLYYELGKYELSTLEEQHLSYYLENVDKTGTFTITGSADSSTGTREMNEKLCAARVDNIVWKLHSVGISDAQIVIKESVIADIPDHPEMGRSVIIEH